MKPFREAEALFAALRESAKPEAVAAIERLITEAPDRALCRINALAFTAEHKLNEEDVIAAFLHAAQLGIFDLSWNILCPGCGGVLNSGTTLKTVNQADYSCALCAAAYEPTLDEMVEVTFTISPRVRKIAAHDPQTLPWIEYFRQLFWSSGVDLPNDDKLANLIKEITLQTVEPVVHVVERGSKGHIAVGIRVDRKARQAIRLVTHLHDEPAQLWLDHAHETR